jgi:gamma-glutamyltranspeptidase/glutathione hydrolase
MNQSMDKIHREQIDTDLLELGQRNLVRPQKVAVSKGGMVSTAHFVATAAGAEMLAAGGNAMDAAVSAAFTLGVCEPAASGLGGQTMMLVHLAEPRRTFALDGSSRAPNRAAPDSLTKADRRRGYRATTVPSTPAVLEYALKHYGKLSLAQVLEPARRAAADGYEVSWLQYLLTRRELKHLKASSGAQFFLRDGTRAYTAGSVFRQPVLAETLQRLAEEGVADFYQGEIGAAIHEDMQANGGILHRDDLAQIPQPIERKPVTGRFASCRVFTFPPPGAGRTLIQMLNVYEQFKPRRQNFDTPAGAIALAETIRRAFLDRQDRPFDPSFFPQVIGERMLKEDYAQLVARQIERRIRTAGETTHLSTIDKEGNVVALTQSIERVYGSCEAAAGLGFLYNNYMSAFDYEDISHPHYMRPNAVPWASVAPTIVFKRRKPWLAIGSPGSERITSSILQVLVRLFQSMSPHRRRRRAAPPLLR